MSERGSDSTDTYVTVAGETRAEITIKRSVFIACTRSVETREAANVYLESLRREFPDAVHHCFAWRLGLHGFEYRMSDDGEPSGTAGKPILFALQRAGVSDTIVVVVRYFGGTKLGVGPLARAYGESARDVLERAPRIVVRPTISVRVHCSYDDVSTVTDVLQAVEATFAPVYSDAVSFDVTMPLSRLTDLASMLADRTNGRAGYSKVGTE